MAAAGGFWAKGTFTSSVETAVLSILYQQSPAMIVQKAKSGDEDWLPWDLKGAVQDELAALSTWHWGMKQAAIAQIGEDKLNAAAKQAAAAAKASAAAKAEEEAAYMAATNLTSFGVSFTNAEVQKLAEANGLTMTQMAAKLAAYKSYASIKKWKKAAEGDGTVQKPAKAVGDVPLPPLEGSGPQAWQKYVGAPDTWAAGSPSALSSTYSGWGAGLGSAETSAIQSYTGTSFTLNNQMRTMWNPEKYPTSMLTQKANAINGAIAKAPAVPHDMVLYRGADVKDLFTAAKKGQLPKGSQVIDPGFMSASTNLTTAKNFTGHNYPVLYRFVVPKGSKGGAYIQPLSHYSAEHEFLWGSGKPMTVLGHKFVTLHGKQVLQLDVVPSEMVQ